MGKSGEEEPLAGVRVLELGGGVPAAFATRWMAGFGADVVRTEGAPGALDGDEEVALLTGKRRIPRDTPRLRELALAADLVVEDGVLAERGLDPHDLRRAKPQLVVTSLSAFGHSGPRADWAATNLVAHAAGGLLSLSGVATREPLVNGANQAWKLLGLNGFSASIAAYFGSLVSGEGDWLDLSAQECAAGMLEYYGPRAAFDGTPTQRLGNRVNALWAIYPCADGFGGVCALNRQVPALFSLIGDPELQQPRFLDPAQRMVDDVELGSRVQRWCSDKTKRELLRLGEAHKVPFGAVLTPGELLENPSLVERDFFDRVTTPSGAALVPGRPFLGLPWRRGELHAAAADGAAVLRDWLGGAA
jgi:crotonobetainyl-CoA:carnitine CoA-transferase CaiB-like acyl-CoA transferase